MLHSQEELQRCRDLWQATRARRRAAHNRVVAAFSHFVAGIGSGPTDDELAGLKACVDAEEDAVHAYVTLLERCLRG